MVLYRSASQLEGVLLDMDPGLMAGYKKVRLVRSEQCERGFTGMQQVDSGTRRLMRGDPLQPVTSEADLHGVLANHLLTNARRLKDGELQSGRRSLP